MRSILVRAQTRSLVETLVRTNEIKMIVAGDDRPLMKTGVSAGEIASVVAATGTGGASLSQPVRELLERFTSVIVSSSRNRIFFSLVFNNLLLVMALIPASVS